jgi:hypothetical protein
MANIGNYIAGFVEIWHNLIDYWAVDWDSIIAHKGLIIRQMRRSP